MTRLRNSFFFLWRRRLGRCALILVLACAALLPIAQAWASKENMVIRAEDVQRHDPLMVLTVGKAEVVDIDGAVSDIMVADPGIVDVVALQSNRMYMVGAKVGNTNVIALDRDGNIVKRMNVHVRVDEETLEDTIHELFPDEKISAKTVNNQVILLGEVSNPTVASQVRDLSIRFVGDEKNLINLLKVSGQMQVMLKVRIMEASRSVIKELGIESSANDQVDGSGAPLLFNQRYPSSIGGGAGGSLINNSQTGLTRDPFSVGRIFYDTGINGIGFTELLVNALEENNLINILAEPNLTAVSGEEANFLAGGEFPVPVGRDNNGNITIEFKPFGVSLNFRPSVLSDNRISLQMKTEVSSLDPEKGLTINEVSVPGLDVRRAETIVEMNSGGSLMIAGLLKAETVKGLAGLPGVRDTPILGKLVSSDSFNRSETELLIVVTPYVVQPIAKRNNATPVGPVGPETSPLSDMFAGNLRQVYGDRAPKIPDMSDRFGYLLD